MLQGEPKKSECPLTLGSSFGSGFVCLWFGGFSFKKKNISSQYFKIFISFFGCIVYIRRKTEA